MTDAKPCAVEQGVTVIVITYNHAMKLRRGLESVLTQRGVAGLRVIVSDDCSTDGTQDVMREMAAKDPRIMAIYRPKNLGSVAHVAECRKLVSTQYFAFLEGDDYYSDPDKLRLEVEALDRHPECSFCAHKTEMRNAAGEEIGIIGNEISEDEAVLDFEAAPYTHPTSRLYRHPAAYGAGFYESFLNNGDLFTWEIAMQYAFLDRAPMVFLNRRMSVYSYDGCGIFSSLTKRQQDLGTRKVLFAVDAQTDFRHTEFLRTRYLPQTEKKKLDWHFRWFGREYRFFIFRLSGAYDAQPLGGKR